jgi:hypothetical protein
VVARRRKQAKNSCKQLHQDKKTASRMAAVARTLNPVLVASAYPGDADVVKGVLAGIFGACSASFSAKKIEDVLHNQGVCDVELLGRLTMSALLDHFQLCYGDAMRVDDCLFPKALQTIIPVVPVTPPLQAPAYATSSRTAPEFPELGGDGLPTAQSVRAWLPGFRSHLAGRLDVGTLAEYDRLAKDTKHTLDPYYVNGATPESDIVWTALIQAGVKGLPGVIVLSFPPLVTETRLGLVALKHILARVFTVSDSSLGVLLTWFQKPEFVTQLWLLGLALTKWLGVRNQLVAEGLPQSDIACRLSLLFLCSKLTELKAVFAALEVAHPLGIPIQVLIDTVRSRADSYSSLRGANLEVSVLAEGYTLVAEQSEKPKKSKKPWKKPYRTTECWKWLEGACSYGDRCRFSHTGEAGQGAQKAALAQDMGQQLQALQAQMTALQTAQGDNTIIISADNNNRSTATNNLINLEKNQDNPSRFKSPNVYGALSASHEEMVKEGEDNITPSNKDNTVVPTVLNSDDNSHRDDNNTPVVLSANVNISNNNSGCAGLQTQEKVVAEHLVKVYCCHHEGLK